MISVKTIHKSEQQRLKRQKELYRRVVSDCSSKIQSQVKLHQQSLFYRVPLFLFGVPLYNIPKIVQFLMQELNRKQFSCMHLMGNIIYISWNSIADNQVMKSKYHENKQESAFDKLTILSRKYKA